MEKYYWIDTTETPIIWCMHLPHTFCINTHFWKTVDWLTECRQVCYFISHCHREGTLNYHTTSVLMAELTTSPPRALEQYLWE